MATQVFKNHLVEQTAWPPGIFEDSLVITYRLGGEHQATEYAKLLRRVNWESLQLEDAVLLTPEETTGAMVKSPRAQGEALPMLLRGEIDMDWVSSDGLRLTSSRLV